MQPEVEEDETLDLSGWWTMVEGMSNRAGMLQKETDEGKSFKKNGSDKEEGVVAESPDLWWRALLWAGGTPSTAGENHHSLPRL